jgi:hypothetical protein
MYRKVFVETGKGPDFLFAGGCGAGRLYKGRCTGDYILFKFLLLFLTEKPCRFSKKGAGLFAV